MLSNSGVEIVLSCSAAAVLWKSEYDCYQYCNHLCYEVYMYLQRGTPSHMAMVILSIACKLSLL